MTETRIRLARHASALFARRGFQRVSTASIARAAGVSHGALFVHFASRDALVRAVSSEFARAMTDELHALALEGASVERVLTAHLSLIEAHEPLYARFVDEMALLDAPSRVAWSGLQSAISVHIGSALSGRLGPIPLPMFFNGWVGLVHHYLVNRNLFAPGRSVIASCGADLVEYYGNLILGATKR